MGAIVHITVVSGRTSDGMRDAISGRHQAHFDRCLPGFGSVVDLGQKMAVDIDHGRVIRKRVLYRLEHMSIKRVIGSSKGKSLGSSITRSSDDPMQLHSYCLLVHDSKHELFCSHLKVEEQLRK